MTRRLVLIAAIAAALLGAPTLQASASHGSSQSSKGGSQKSGSSKSSSSKGTKTKSSSGDKTVHVHGYYRKDGTYVEGYDRRAPGTASEPSSPSTAGSSGSSTVQRDSTGHVVRSEAAKDRFMRETGYPHGRPGYVVDHIVPLACGGADAPSNMQWQTAEDAKAKDKTERKGCR